MAQEECGGHIGERGVVKLDKPKVILFDFMSIACKSGFTKVLYDAVRKDGLKIIQEMWRDDKFQEAIKDVRDQTDKDLRGYQVPVIAAFNEDIERQQETLQNNIVWYLEKKRETPAHFKIKFLMYLNLYSKGILKTPIHAEVPLALTTCWKQRGIKVVSLSRFWAGCQRFFMKYTEVHKLGPTGGTYRSEAGDMSTYVDEVYDTKTLGGNLTDASVWDRLPSLLGVGAHEILFITKDTREGRLSKEWGIHSVLLIGHELQEDRYSQEELKSFERIRKLTQLKWYDYQ